MLASACRGSEGKLTLSLILTALEDTISGFVKFRLMSRYRLDWCVTFQVNPSKVAFDSGPGMTSTFNTGRSSMVTFDSSILELPLTMSLRYIVPLLIICRLGTANTSLLNPTATTPVCVT